MIKKLLLVLVMLAVKSYGQQKPVLIFDLTNDTLDSLEHVVFDTTVISSETKHNLGYFDTDIASLELDPPLSNLFPNSEFTLKKKVLDDFDPSDYPIRTTVKIFTEKEGVLIGNCSGSFISRKHVLTAAHCILGLNTDTLRINSINVCPVFDQGDFSPHFDCTYVSKVYSFKDWNIMHEDFALLELEKPIGESTGWIGIGFNDFDSALTDGIFYKFTYPSGELPLLDSNTYNGDTLYYNYGKMNVVNTHSIGTSNAYGITGESGSSLLKIVGEQSYTSYGVLSFSVDLIHSRLKRWQFYALENIIRDDLILGKPRRGNGADWIIYPNPTTGVVKLENLPWHKINEIKLYDSQGRTIRFDTYLLRETGLNISHLVDGIYYLALVTNEATEIRKIVKK